MKVSSSIRPKDVEILQSEGSKVVIALRDNIIETSEVDLLTGKPLVNYKYDEVKIIARKRDNLLESINWPASLNVKSGVTLILASELPFSIS